MVTRRRVAILTAGLAFTAGVSIAVAPSASANTTADCPSNELCLYQYTSFEHPANNPRIVSVSTNSCFDTFAVRDADFYLVSYVNNLPVAAHSYFGSNGNYTVTKTFPAGGFSSNITNSGYGELVDPLICTGNADPADYFG